MKRAFILFGLFLIVLFTVSSFSAILSTATGNISAEVLSIDKAGVTIRAKLGTTTFKASDVKYVLMDESKTDLVGMPGVVLKNGLVFHGEPNQITNTSGVISTDYGIIQTTLQNIVYFSYNRSKELDTVMSLTIGLLPRIVAETKQTNVTLINGSKANIKEFKVTQEGNKTKFILTDEYGTYIFDSNVINRIEVDETNSANYKNYIETKDGAMILCNIIFAGENVLLTVPFDNKIVVKFNELSKIIEKSMDSPAYSRFLNAGTYIPASYNYDSSSKTLTINILTEKLSFEGKLYDQIVIDIPKQ